LYRCRYTAAVVPPQHPLEADRDQQEEYRCGYCGRRCKSEADLAKHFKQLHEREYKKKMGNPNARKRMVKDTEKMDK
jgi:uncharacterized C2H2 Zn-finger protein